jgi:hypothetical protein
MSSTASYGAVPTSAAPDAASLINEFTGALDSNKIITATRQEISSIIKYVEDGNWTWKVLGSFGGIAMVACGSLSFLGHFLLFDYFGAILDVYIVLFGLLSIVLEYKDTFLPAKWVEQLKVEAKFMYKPYGRAVLYIFFGILLISQQSLLYICTGFYLIGVGGTVVYYATQAQKALQNFKDQKLSFYQLRDAYDKADKDKKGLTPAELSSMVSKFPGCAMSENEVLSAVDLLDKDSSGRVSYDEFSKWYNAR